ncbi:MAG: sigma factor-like helix-turn-helix DNA-binding protein [Candidatus Colwellbacteria bacterium]|nr:sigma factor-like helix-turn-helix DNA-binding protein [Candidatus Colwellbacteria bacterium]
MNLYSIDFDNLTEDLIESAGLDARSANIIHRRFGLGSPETATLQELGAKYSVTRERVRQLETQAVSEIRRSAESLKEAADILDFVRSYIESAGGVKKDEILVRELHLLAKAKEEEAMFGNRIKFLFEVMKYPYFYGETENFHDFWYSNNDICAKLDIIHEELLSKLKKVEHFSEILREVASPQGMSDPVAMNLLSVSKKIGVGPYGDIGLSHWEEINPKTVRAKAFLLLKKQDRPMHFTDIAEAIGSHAPTVHNELIKDPRFELVSRGTYALKLE